MTVKLTVIARDGEEREIESSAGNSLMVAIRDSSFGGILALCGGSCSCATCHIYIESSNGADLQPTGENERDLLDCVANRVPTSRLACQVRLAETLNGLRVRIAPEE